MQASSGAVDSPQALVPLTVFDRLFERTTFLTGWLVEGTIDASAFRAALDRLTQKWPMLSGRLESIIENNETHWRIRVPLGPLPADYRAYVFTTSTSELPLSHYVSVPLPLVSPSLPYSLFIHPSTPRRYSTWEATSYPLTCWHVTHFPADSAKNEQAYSCIGFARSHGVFDGVGAALIMKALVAEMKGRDWDIPALPTQGLNINPLQAILEVEANSGKYMDVNEEGYQDERYSILGVGGVVKFVAWHLWERWWKSAERRILILPKEVLSFLVDGTRAAMDHKNPRSDKVTTGDILVAWLVKTIYSSGTPPETIIHCSNLASFRSIMPTSTSLLDYPHNAFVPLPYPPMSVDEVNSLSLPVLTQQLFLFRSSLSTEHAVSAFRTMQSYATAVPVHPGADESLVVSNVSASRILESDWSAVGGLNTLCGYRYQLTPTKVMLANAVYISGRLSDGSVVLDMTLSQDRLDILTEEVNRLLRMVQK